MSTTRNLLVNNNYAPSTNLITDSQTLQPKESRPTPINPTKLVITTEEWSKRLSQITLSKTDMNKLVMNYLVVEGYKEAAEKFGRETGVRPTMELDTIEDRMHIRNAIQSGNINAAIERMNTLNPDILDCNPKMTFHLLLQQLIELIRSSDYTNALEFAQEQLAPRGEQNPEFLMELERVMALMVFDPNSKSPLSGLLEPVHRIKTANEVNAALLSSQCQDKDSKLPTMMKLLSWAQGQLDDRLIYPKITDFVNLKFDQKPSQ